MAAEEEREKAVYIRVPRCIGGDEWLMLNLEKDEATPAGLERMMKWPLMKSNKRSTQVALGSMIYFLGGVTLRGFFNTSDHDDVFCFDTRCPNKGLKKTIPMNSHRSNALAAALDGKIYVFAGRRSPYGEVFDPDRGLWALLPEPPDFLGALLSDPSNARLLAHSRDDLYAYYPASNSWKSLNVNLSHYWTDTPCVIVDDVIYFCFTPDPDDHTHCLAAYDLVSNQPLDIKWPSDSDFASVFATIPDFGYNMWEVLHHLGNGKLCAAMSARLNDTTPETEPEAAYAVLCLTLKVHKEPAGNTVLVTEPSSHLIRFLAAAPARDFLIL